MRSRLALVCVIAFGALFSGAGATLALSGSESASQAVYPRSVNPTPQILGQQQSSQPQSLPSTTTHTPSSVQPTRQVAASSPSETLPFTGLAAIPVLVLGLGMLVAGVVLSRRTRRRDDSA